MRDEIQRRLASSRLPNALDATVVPCHDPQLVVVRGLLLDQEQKSESGCMPVLARRIARASYGIVARELYSPARHFDAELIQDEFDPKKRWAINQIQWLVRKVGIFCPGLRRQLANS